MSCPISINTLHILVGLPGSGKITFYFEQTKKAPFYSIHYIDFDTIKRNARFKDSEDLKEYYAYEIYLLGGAKDTCVDGLFLTPDDFDFIVSLCLNCPRYNIKNVRFEYWEPNVEACLWDDKNRRTISSSVSIRKLVVHQPDVKYFAGKYPTISFSCQHHTIVRKPEWKIFFEEYGICLDKNDHVLRSPD